MLQCYGFAVRGRCGKGVLQLGCVAERRVAVRGVVVMGCSSNGRACLITLLSNFEIF